MFGIVFRIEAQPGKYQELVEFLRWDGEVCRDREPGTLRFDFYRDPPLLQIPHRTAETPHVDRTHRTVDG
jgi:quinol monooxygenase YgiN